MNAVKDSSISPEEMHLDLTAVIMIIIIVIKWKFL